MMDIIDRLRHTLIRWLSAGDMVMLNFEIRSDQKYQPTNLGPALVYNVSVRYSSCDAAISFGPFRGRAALGIAHCASMQIGNLSVSPAYLSDLSLKAMEGEQ